MQKYQQFLICLHKKYASKNTAIGKTNMIYCNSNKRQSYRLMAGTYKRYGVKMLISFNSFVFLLLGAFWGLPKKKGTLIRDVQTWNNLKKRNARCRSS